MASCVGMSAFHVVVPPSPRVTTVLVSPEFPNPHDIDSHLEISFMVNQFCSRSAMRRVNLI